MLDKTQIIGGTHININDLPRNYKICNYCGKGFESTIKDERFCCKDCETKYKLNYEKMKDERKREFLIDYMNWKNNRPQFLNI